MISEVSHGGSCHDMRGHGRAHFCNPTAYEVVAADKHDVSTYVITAASDWLQCFVEILDFAFCFVRISGVDPNQAGDIWFIHKVVRFTGAKHSIQDLGRK